MVQICLYCLNCTKFRQLILRNIIKIVATRCLDVHLGQSSHELIIAKYFATVLELPGGRGDAPPTAIACPRHWLYSWHPRGGQHLSLALVRNFVAALGLQSQHH